MIQGRNIVLCIVFTIITCGIYGIYWFIKLTDEMNMVSGQQGTTGGTAFLLTLVTCGIYGWYWAYKQGEKVDILKTNSGMPSSNTGVIYLVLCVVGLGIVAYCLMQSEINKCVGFNG